MTTPLALPRGNTSSSSSGISTPGLPVGTTEIVSSDNMDDSDTPYQQGTTKITHLGASRVTHEVQEDGSLYIRPLDAKIPSKASARGQKVKVKHVITFQPRFSAFDRFNPNSQVDPFRGFYTLFWIFLLIQGLRTFRNGEPLSLEGWKFWSLISADALHLAISDGLMVGSTLLCVPFMKMIEKGWLRYYWTGNIIQHFWQAAFVGVAILWTFKRNWYWVQSGFLTLHTIAMLMKIHSYLAVNGLMSSKKISLDKKRAKLEQVVEELGGTAVVGRTARVEVEKYLREEEMMKRLQAATESKPTNTDRDEEERRRESSAEVPPCQPSRRVLQDQSALMPPCTNPDLPTASLELLSWHPDESLSKLANEAIDLEEALTSDGVKKVRWPANITMLNFVDYLLVPTLVYELEYPRTNRIRPVYVFEKVLATFGTFSLIIMITEFYIYPIAPSPGEYKSFIDVALDLAIPFMVQYLLIFYIIFECICNAFAELTMFADREFYQDWWNSVTWDQFARRWNKPVHSFLMKHVYASTRSTYGISRGSAAFVTFFLSACFHELVMAVVTKKIRMYLFFMQMAQLPLIAMGRIKLMRENPALGNITFWFGLLSGFPLLAVCYLVF
ncbi:hypothetical protein BT69DRAFT_1259288 [Atractiella rhizophila]|nr:hypothetical protein BT69DRAFT_1259288 [Atractiella rhizophila]